MELTFRGPSLTTPVRQLTVTLLVFLSIAAAYCSTNDSNQTKAEIRTDPSHISWTSANARYDFVFNIRGPIKPTIKLESDPANFLTNSLANCNNHSACLFRDGKYLEAFQLTTTSTHKSIFTPSKNVTVPAKTTNTTRECDNGNKFEISHYCSTNWNPPVHLARINCNHIIEWHSPITCTSVSTNQEHPCYIYAPSGKLIDLTRWILSNGTSYQVDTNGNTKVKQFNLNVCNEAHTPCGPNVSACYVDDQLGTIESGYNNQTSINYNAKDGTVLLTSLGHHKPQCEDSRVKTVIRFICNSKVIPKTGPKLVRSSACESIIEWPTVYACPTTEVSAPATDCRIKYEPLGIEIDLMKLTNQKNMVEVPNVMIDGVNKKMLLGLCEAIPKSVACEGKSNLQTKSCLLEAHSNLTSNTASSSKIVGSVSRSTIRLSDIDRVYLESFAINKTCSEPVRKDFNVTRKVGTRIEFFCSERRQELPNFINYDDCIYIFEWGTPELCSETLRGTSEIVAPKAKEARAHSDVETRNQDVHERVIKKAEIPKVNGAHKFFMISLIVMSFAAFIVVIFVLDKKTRLRITLRQARQVFQSNHQPPYSRVVSDLHL